MEEYQEAARLSPERADAYLGVANIYAIWNDPRRIEILRDAAERTNDSLEHRLILGQLADLDKDYYGALRHYLTALEAYPDHPHILSAVGNVYLHTRQYQEAQDMLSRALTSPDFDPKTSYMLGIAEQALGNRRAALKAYEDAFNADPDYYDALRALAQMEFRLLRFGAWTRHVKHALRINMAKLES